MRMVLAGSQLLGAKTAERLKRSFPNSDILLYYGASELDYITWLGYDEVLRFPDSVGKPVPGVKVWVENGIFNGREGDILNKGGFKISCTKIENALCALPEVIQAVVLPYDDAGRGQEAAAFVVCENENRTKQDLRLRLRDTLMQQEMPKKIILVKIIPLNSRGKTDKKALLALL